MQCVILIMTLSVSLVASQDNEHKSASYTVTKGGQGTWRCGFSESFTDSRNKPVTDAIISELS